MQGGDEANPIAIFQYALFLIRELPIHLIHKHKNTWSSIDI